ncbi:tetratricopeptide repeat protein, partial [Planctomycetota bacterium]
MRTTPTPHHTKLRSAVSPRHPHLPIAQLQAIGQELMLSPGNDDLYRTYINLVSKRPDAAEGLCDLGIAMAELGYMDRAQNCFCQAIAHDPTHAPYQFNLGRLLRDIGHLDAAIASYREAIRLDPQYADAHWNLALALLACGNYSEGWQEFAWRRKAQLSAILPSQQNDAPTWSGQSFFGKRLLIRFEQGLGDSIQCVRFLPLVKERGGTVVLETPPGLRPVFERLDGVDECVPAAVDGIPRTPYDLHAFFFDLPTILHTTVETIPHRIPYLTCPPDKIDLWQRRLQGPKTKIGVVWAGSPKHTRDAL